MEPKENKTNKTKHEQTHRHREQANGCKTGGGGGWVGKTLPFQLWKGPETSGVTALKVTTFK